MSLFEGLYITLDKIFLSFLWCSSMQSGYTSSEFMGRSVRAQICLLLPLCRILLIDVIMVLWFHDVMQCSFLSEGSNHCRANYQWATIAHKISEAIGFRVEYRTAGKV